MKIINNTKSVILIGLVIIMLFIILSVNLYFDNRTAEMPGNIQIDQEIESMRLELSTALVNYYQGNGDIKEVRKIKSKLDEKLELIK